MDAVEEGQKYKVGKFILETGMVVKGGGWEGVDRGDEAGVGREMGGSGDSEEEEIQFDSQDEDECEDLFSGVWSAEMAGRRRGRRVVT